MKKRIDVAVAVVMGPQSGQVLWAQRPPGKPYEGYWEFPGGKVEPGEAVWSALVRELQEELGILATAGGPWFVVDYDYEHANVRLHMIRVWAFESVPTPLEGQAWCWASLNDPGLAPILPATEPLLSRMALPQHMVLTDAHRAVDPVFHAFLNQSPHRWLVQFRDKRSPAAVLANAFEALAPVCQKVGHGVVMNSDTWAVLAQQPSSRWGGRPPCPLHLTENALRAAAAGGYSDSRPTNALGASVHDADTLELAHQLGLSYAVLGSVQASASHPGQAGLGWAQFAEIKANARLPVYAIGGLAPGDLSAAMQAGAHGVACLSRFR